MSVGLHDISFLFDKNTCAHSLTFHRKKIKCTEVVTIKTLSLPRYEWRQVRASYQKHKCHWRACMQNMQVKLCRIDNTKECHLHTVHIFSRSRIFHIQSLAAHDWVLRPLWPDWCSESMSVWRTSWRTDPPLPSVRHSWLTCSSCLGWGGQALFTLVNTIFRSCPYPLSALC